MDEYTIQLARSARKEIEGLDSRVVSRILPKIEALSKQPRPVGCKKITGENDLWRVRVGEYRIIYSIDDKNRIIAILVVRHRSDVYR